MSGCWTCKRVHDLDTDCMDAAEARIRELEAREATWDMRHERETRLADIAYKRADKLEAALRKCCRVLKDGSMGDAQAVYAEASALVTASETKADANHD